MTELSVVLISKNQEWNIARLVESVLRETESLSERQIMLVDSASTDRTAEIAAQYPISVLKLHPDQRLTAAAGRYVGFLQTTGDLVLFLDGDMELCAGWLRPALKIMNSNHDVATICGLIVDQPLASQTPITEPIETSSTDPSGEDVRQAGGAAMYRRSVLEQVGTFNPYLYSDEEPELCLRIRHAGYRIHRLFRPISFHYTAPPDAFTTLLGRRDRRLWLGFGQNIRYFIGSSLLWPYLKERGWVMLPALAVCISALILIISGLTGQWGWLALWGVFGVILILGTAIHKHSLRRAIFSLFQRLLILEGTVRGLFMKPNDPTGFPKKYDIIQQSRNSSCERITGLCPHKSYQEAGSDTHGQHIFP